MNQALYFEERVLFSPNIPKDVNALLQTGVALTNSDKTQAEELFKEARQLDSSCLQTYFALYKFYFHHKRLKDAENEVFKALQEAAKQSGLPQDYRTLSRRPEDWDMYQNEVRLFYLYSLKALAFIKLRTEHKIEAKLILSLLERLDPEDRCGASVIISLSQGLGSRHYG